MTLARPYLKVLLMKDLVYGFFLNVLRGFHAFSFIHRLNCSQGKGDQEAVILSPVSPSW
jgi:hypothetical protein